MSSLVEKLARLADRIEKDKGPLRLLAMFYRDDVPPTWDLIVSAERLHLDNMPDLKYLSDLLGPTLNRRETLTLSRMIIFESRHPQTDEALKEIGGRTGYMELRGDFVGFPIRAEVIRAQPPGGKPAGVRKPQKRVVRRTGQRPGGAAHRQGATKAS